MTGGFGKLSMKQPPSSAFDFFNFQDPVQVFLTWNGQSALMSIASYLSFIILNQQSKRFISASQFDKSWIKKHHFSRRFEKCVLFFDFSSNQYIFQLKLI